MAELSCRTSLPDRVPFGALSVGEFGYFAGYRKVVVGSPAGGQIRDAGQWLFMR